MAANIRFINPDTLSKPPTYTQVVEVTGPGRTVYISGQLADRPRRQARRPATSAPRRCRCSRI